MSETHPSPGLASYECEVAELMQAGAPFGEIEDAIDEVADLTENAKAALWLLAFSLQKPGEQVRAARAHFAAVA